MHYEDEYTPEGWHDILDLSPTATQTETRDKINELIGHINFQARMLIGIGE